MVALRGVGTGNNPNSHGPYPGAGRPKARRNRKSKALIAQIQENKRTDPLDFLTRVMDDERLQMRDRVSAGIALMPYFHVRLSVMKVAPNVMTMPDDELLRLLEQIGERLGPTSAADRSHALVDQA